jgi:uncharacterized membrane protein (DUF485 family)
MGYSVTSTVEVSLNRSLAGRAGRLALLALYPVSYWIIVYVPRWLAARLKWPVDSVLVFAISVAFSVAYVLILLAVMREAFRRARRLARKPAKFAVTKTTGGVNDPWLDACSP